MKTVAVLLDLGFVLHRLYRKLGNSHATAQHVREFAEACLQEDEELFRIYCYHALPFAGTRTHPIDKTAVHFEQTATYQRATKLIDDLKVMDNIAFRAGDLSFDGWKLKYKATRDIIRTGRAVRADDIEPDLKQKGVDMKIGLDVAWLASRALVERIIVVSADSDLVPAMKFARREGVQIVLVAMDHLQIKRALIEHSDFTRDVAYPISPSNVGDEQRSESPKEGQKRRSSRRR